MAKREEVKKKTSIGGQALIEGIMMRGPEKTSMAVRHVSGEIVVEEWPTSGSKRAKIWKLPLFRGVYNFVDSMVFGYKCLMRSAELSGLEEEEEQPAKGERKESAAREEASPAPAVVPAAGAALDGTAEETDGPALSAPAVPAGEAPAEPLPAEAETAPAVLPAAPLSPDSAHQAAPEGAVKEDKGDKADKESKEDKEGFFARYGMTFLMVLSSVLGVALAIALFFYLPSFLFNLLTKPFPALDHTVWRAVFEGILRILLFIAYIAAVSLMKDIRRVFQYHGAEHKCIFCYEKGLPLTVENVRGQIRFHPRCGTSFMILMLSVGIVISMFIPIAVPILRTGVKLLTIPLVVGIGYELIKWAGRSDSLAVRIISAPGLWVQRLTTKEPDDSMIEVAIAALNRVIPEDPEMDRL